MASAHHLLAAAFSLCGLLFLLHVVTVNSLRCKVCSSEDEGCLSGDVPGVDCGSLNVCVTVVLFYNDGRKINVSYRTCTSSKWRFKCRDISEGFVCYGYCDTDNCNNVSYVDYEED